jgi:hypothetical protein
MPPPEGFLRHLREAGYHPRSSRHSDALSSAIIADLVARCEVMAHDVRAGKLVYDLNMDLRFGTSTWNVDLVLGSPATPAATQAPMIARSTPASVRIALEIKGVMTEHRKAVKNRKRDFEAHHEHVHNYDRRAIAAGVMVINAAERFRSPLRQEVTVNGNRAPPCALSNTASTRCAMSRRAVAIRRMEWTPRQPLSSISTTSISSRRSTLPLRPLPARAIPFTTTASSSAFATPIVIAS